MKRKAMMCLTIAACTLLTGCSGLSQKQDTAYVQTVSSILGSDISGNNRYTGVVESSKTQKISKDSSKKISEIRVKEGDMVKKGDVLFTYDKTTLQMSVDTASLEVEAISNKISSYQAQIKQLQKDKKSAPKSEQLSYSLQIQEAQLNLSEEQYNLKAKQKELDNAKDGLNHVNVTAEVDGLVQSVQSDDSASDNGAFITILETTVQQIKGTVSEMEVASLTEGEPVTVYSRLNDNKTWGGKISKISTEGTVDNSDQEYSGEDDSSASGASKYSFYVTLSSSDGLMMGQHVYIEPGERPNNGALWLYADYIVKDGDKAYVWAADKKNNLYKQEITLGRHNEENNTYEIVSGLKLEDYIAYPSDSLQEGQKATLSDGTDSDEPETGSGEIPDDAEQAPIEEAPADAAPAEGGNA
ncbi:MAG: efflux RND transporter periplasmic adaptor subunit [Eubacteriales bacterium]|nr:efflux RND transporter periplasmic adaptor subunit [Eubacteriales bacterium]